MGRLRAQVIWWFDWRKGPGRLLADRKLSSGIIFLQKTPSSGQDGDKMVYSLPNLLIRDRNLETQVLLDPSSGGRRQSLNDTGRKKEKTQTWPWPPEAGSLLQNLATMQNVTRVRTGVSVKCLGKQTRCNWCLYNIHLGWSQTAWFMLLSQHDSVQFNCSVMSHSLWPTMDCSTPAFPVHHQLLELAQTHIHWVSDAIQPSHPLSSPSFFSCLQSFPTSGSFLMSQFFTSGGQSIRASASAWIS